MPTLKIGNVVFESIAAVVWDKDGTLANSHPFLKGLAQTRAECLDQVVPGLGDRLLSAFGCAGDTYDPTGLMAVGTRYDNEVAAASLVAATGQPWAEALAIAKTAFAESDRLLPRKAPHTPPFAGVPELLHTLHGAGIKLAVLSGDTTQNVQDFIAYHNLTDVIGWCAGSEKPPIKPDPEMLWQACDALKIKAKQCLVVGDAELDYQLAYAGKASGFISVTWGGSPAIANARVVIDQPDAIQILP